MIENYGDFPCLCGHMESSHLRVTGKCRGKKCDCNEFANLQYVRWRIAAIQADVEVLLRFLERSAQRLDAEEKQHD